MTESDRPWIKHYDEGVDPDLPLPDESFAHLLEASFAQHADLTALHFLGTTMRFGELDSLSRRFSHFLSANGYGPGTVVGISLPNIPQYLIALTGAMRTGCTVMGVSPLLTGHELAHQLNDSGASVLVTLDAIFERALLPVHSDVPQLKHVVTTNLGEYLPPIKRVLGRIFGKLPRGTVTPLPNKDVISFRDITKHHLAECIAPELTPQAPCLLQYTGGTTGMPKGASLSQRAVSAVVLNGAQWLSKGAEQEVYCSAYPFFHIAGCSIGLSAILLGNAQILLPDPRNTKVICEEMVKNPPTFVCKVPTLFQCLLEEPAFRALDFSRCKAFVSGAAPFTADSIKALEAVVGAGKVVEAYGMTETSGAVTSNPVFGTKKIGSVGVPQQNVRVKIVDLDTGTEEQSCNAEGEIIVRSPQNLDGYYNKPKETANALRDFQGERWLYTGDVGKMDEDGYLFIVDRTKDMINVSGYKVFCTEVEAVLHEHPAVLSCALVGVPDADHPGSEKVKLVIQRAATHRGSDEDQLRNDITAFCRDELAPYKVPKIIAFVDELPLTSVGKIDKKQLRT